uniref:Uncharacterized protein n=1 Tax=Candidatus Kentrum sp. MB TaxID=2138164 RepID=A0A451B8E0_9GAMM|nr:MAG: hypothetical protein BECKMB1821G_GA0114241_100362 [Candidatus Kentron sp. MB]VFK26581.1 MAG: hypothetical protein BECKMB1821I_GA0114274_100148 [Candidatus Kentron sp. MB]VFK74535.1 MAG: hypothetical protein BECKMB1821H_GA0114242_100626 [Candidatus Kentron sp. MB]
MNNYPNIRVGYRVFKGFKIRSGFGVAKAEELEIAYTQKPCYLRKMDVVTSSEAFR